MVGSVCALGNVFWVVTLLQQHLVPTELISLMQQVGASAACSVGIKRPIKFIFGYLGAFSVYACPKITNISNPIAQVKFCENLDSSKMACQVVLSPAWWVVEVRWVGVGDIIKKNTHRQYIGIFSRYRQIIVIGRNIFGNYRKIIDIENVHPISSDKHCS